jgi:hypothetical protein
LFEKTWDDHRNGIFEIMPFKGEEGDDEEKK